MSLTRALLLSAGLLAHDVPGAARVEYRVVAGIGVGIRRQHRESLQDGVEVGDAGAVAAGQHPDGEAFILNLGEEGVDPDLVGPGDDALAGGEGELVDVLLDKLIFEGDLVVWRPSLASQR